MDKDHLVTIDVHVHANTSQRVPDDPAWRVVQEASGRYFKEEGPRPTIPIDPVCKYAPQAQNALWQRLSFRHARSLDG